MALNEDEQTDAVFQSVRTEVDPVSGNEVPPGSLPEEVRDDIPAMLSEGEYVVPADVLRFYGVKFFEDLRRKAKDGLAKMEEDGRIGGEPIEDEEDQMDLPFSDEELETMEMDEGGLVGFSNGGLPEDTQVDIDPGAAFTQDPNDPTQVIMNYGGGTSSGGYSFVKFYGPDGQEIEVPFYNGMQIGSAPEGYTMEAPAEEEVVNNNNDDPNEGLADSVRAAERKSRNIDYNTADYAGLKEGVNRYHSSRALPILSGILTGGVGTAVFGAARKFDQKKLLAAIDRKIDMVKKPDQVKMFQDLRKGLTDREYYNKNYKEKFDFGKTFLGDLLGVGEGDDFGLSQERIDAMKKQPEFKYNTVNGQLSDKPNPSYPWAGSERKAYDAAVQRGDDTIVAHFQAIDRLRSGQNDFYDAYSKLKTPEEREAFKRDAIRGNMSKYSVQQAIDFKGSLHRAIMDDTVIRSGGAFSKYVLKDPLTATNSGIGQGGSNSQPTTTSTGPGSNASSNQSAAQTALNSSAAAQQTSDIIAASDTGGPSGAANQANTAAQAQQIQENLESAAQNPSGTISLKEGGLASKTKKKKSKT